MMITSSAVASSFSNVISFERPCSAARSDQIHFAEVKQSESRHLSECNTLKISKTLIDEEGGFTL